MDRLQSDDLVRMARRAQPNGLSIIPDSTPVVAFGDLLGARVATLSLNPSRVEFLGTSGLLTGDKARLATRSSLGVDHDRRLSEAQGRAVVEACVTYFGRNPYHKWFRPLDEVLSAALGVSYYDGTACHLDLSQWATDPVWAHLPPGTRQALIAEGAPHLATQLRSGHIRTVVVNGSTVWRELSRAGLVEFEDVAPFTYGARGVSSWLRAGEGLGVRFVGWTLNLQSSPGVRRVDRLALARLLEHAARDGDAASRHLDRTTVRSKAAFVRLLRTWHATSEAATIGDVGTFGRAGVVRLELGSATVVLNADTKRSAVTSFLETVDRRGVDASWRILPNKNGKANKVDFAETGPATAGWYCYVVDGPEGLGTV